MTEIVTYMISLLTSLCVICSMMYVAIHERGNRQKVVQRLLTSFCENRWLYLMMWILGFFAFVLLAGAYKVVWITALKWQTVLMFMIWFAKKDKEEEIIPNTMILCLLAWGIAEVGIQLWFYRSFALLFLTSSLAGGIIAFLLLLVCSFLSKGGFGAGDVKLFAACGFLIGLRGIFNVLLFTMIFGAVCGGYLIIRKRKTAKDTMPLAPFMLAGVLTAIVLGL